MTVLDKSSALQFLKRFQKGPSDLGNDREQGTARFRVPERRCFSAFSVLCLHLGSKGRGSQQSVRTPTCRPQCLHKPHSEPSTRALPRGQLAKIKKTKTPQNQKQRNTHAHAQQAGQNYEGTAKRTPTEGTEEQEMGSRESTGFRKPGYNPGRDQGTAAETGFSAQCAGSGQRDGSRARGAAPCDTGSGLSQF